MAPHKRTLKAASSISVFLLPPPPPSIVNTEVKGRGGIPVVALGGRVHQTWTSSVGRTSQRTDSDVRSNLTHGHHLTPAFLRASGNEELIKMRCGRAQFSGKHQQSRSCLFNYRTHSTSILLTVPPRLRQTPTQPQHK